MKFFEKSLSAIITGMNMSDKDRRTLATNLRKARLAAGMTQEELARQVGITTNYYARLERGDGLPALNTLYGIAKVTKIPSVKILPF